jgi:hypothetical protein
VKYSQIDKKNTVMVHNLKFALIIIAVATLTASCTNDPASSIQPGSHLQSDSGWRVVLFWDKDKDETSDYNQYTFFFHNSGVFEAVSSASTTSGTWRTTSDDGLQRLVLFSSATKPLSELNDDWVIVQSDDQKIQLKDDNDTHLEELVFERI